MNLPSAVASASDKIMCLQKLSENPNISDNILKYFTSTVDTIDYKRSNPEDYIYCRTKTRSSGGEGIVIADTIEQLVPAPLYTVGIRIRREYRVHVFKGKVIDVVQKRRRLIDGAPDLNCDLRIRNHSRGWVFCHDNVERLTEVDNLAVAAVETLGLDFGAVDIVVQKQTGKPFVLEINTAPGLEDTRTLTAYTNAIKEVVLGA